MVDIFIKSNFNRPKYKNKYIIEKSFGNSINIFPFINDISKTNSLKVKIDNSKKFNISKIIEINYINKNEKEKMQLFGGKFILHNDKKCIIIENNKEYKSIKYFVEFIQEKRKNELEIKLKIINSQIVAQCFMNALL